MTKVNNKIWAIVAKDIRSETRTKEVLTLVFVFALLAVLIFSFALQPKPETTSVLAPGMLWVAITFAGVLGFGRSFLQEKDRACLDGLLLCPVDRDAIYWGKLIGNFLFLTVVEIIIVPIFFVLMNLPFSFLLPVALVVVLATAGFVSVGTLFAAMSVNTRATDILLPVLFFPVVVPVVIAAVQCTGGILSGVGWGDLASWMEMIVAFDVIFIMVSSFVFRFVVEG